MDLQFPVLHPSMLPPDPDCCRRVFAVLDGKGEGDGKPRGFLALVDPLPPVA
jgi:hypothetical protein